MTSYQKSLLSTIQISSPCAPLVMNTHPNQGTGALELQVLHLSFLAENPHPAPFLGVCTFLFSLPLSFSIKLCCYFVICVSLSSSLFGTQGPRIFSSRVFWDHPPVTKEPDPRVDMPLTVSIQHQCCNTGKAETWEEIQLIWSKEEALLWPIPLEGKISSVESSEDLAGRCEPLS
jgi:hypothetical protein